MPFLANAFVGVLYTVTALKSVFITLRTFQLSTAITASTRESLWDLRKGAFADKVVGYGINFNSTRL